MIAATQLKPDEGTPELPDGMVRVRLDTDGSLHDVTEYETEQVERPFPSLSRLSFKAWNPLPLCSVIPRSRTCARTWATCSTWTNVESWTLWAVAPEPTCRSHTPVPTWSTSGLRFRPTARWNQQHNLFWNAKCWVQAVGRVKMSRNDLQAVRIMSLLHLIWFKATENFDV